MILCILYCLAEIRKLVVDNSQPLKPILASVYTPLYKLATVLAPFLAQST